MDYVAPYVIHGTHRMDEGDVAREGERYRRLLTLLHDDRLDYARRRPDDVG